MNVLLLAIVTIAIKTSLSNVVVSFNERVSVWPDVATPLVQLSNPSFLCATQGTVFFTGNKDDIWMLYGILPDGTQKKYMVQWPAKPTGMTCGTENTNTYFVQRQTKKMSWLTAGGILPDAPVQPEGTVSALWEDELATNGSGLYLSIENGTSVSVVRVQQSAITAIASIDSNPTNSPTLFGHHQSVPVALLGGSRLFDLNTGSQINLLTTEVKSWIGSIGNNGYYTEGALGSSTCQATLRPIGQQVDVLQSVCSVFPPYVHTKTKLWWIDPTTGNKVDTNIALPATPQIRKVAMESLSRSSVVIQFKDGSLKQLSREGEAFNIVDTQQQQPQDLPSDITCSQFCTVAGNLAEQEKNNQATSQNTPGSPSSSTEGGSNKPPPWAYLVVGVGLIVLTFALFAGTLMIIKTIKASKTSKKEKDEYQTGSQPYEDFPTQASDEWSDTLT